MTIAAGLGVALGHPHAAAGRQSPTRKAADANTPEGQTPDWVPAGAHAPNLNVDDLSAAAKQTIKDRFRPSLILPELALWKFDELRPYPTGGVAVCGRVNFPSSTRVYTGDKPFYALFQHGQITAAAIVERIEEDPVRATASAWAIACTAYR